MQTRQRILGTLALLTTGIVAFAAGRTSAQAAPTNPRTEQHEWLAGFDGEYVGAVSGMLGESKGTNRIETELGGLWSIRRFESTLMGQPFEGLEILGYDPLKEKFVSVWVDSMTPLVMNMEGTYDAETKTLTMRGISRGMDGEVGEMVNTTEFEDGGMTWTMKVEGAPVMSIDYKRK